MALAPTLWWLFAGRVISGITAASFATAGAYIADVTPPEKRVASFGMIGAAWGVGFVMGPALGGVLGVVNPRLPFWVAAGLTLLNALYGLFVLPESLAPESRKAFAWRRANPIGSLILLRSHPELFMGLLGPAAQGLMTRHVGPSEQGQLQGANSSLMGITGLIGPGLFTLTFASFIGTHRDWHLPGAAFLLAALLMTIALVLAWRITSRRSEIKL